MKVWSDLDSELELDYGLVRIGVKSGLEFGLGLSFGYYALHYLLLSSRH